MANDISQAGRVGRVGPIVHLAASGDLHAGTDSIGRIRPGFLGVAQVADLLVLAGDLTQHGDPAEGRLLANELSELGLPIVAVLGNHDYHHGSEQAIRGALEAAGVSVLEGEVFQLDVRGCRVGIAGSKGFGGGFAGACGTEFGEPEMKAFIRYTKRTAGGLRNALAALDSEIRIALTHFSPVKETLMGERPEIYPFLGSYLLGEAIDSVRCDLALHGHAHHGIEHGVTVGGVPVRNVARPVIRLSYKVYEVAAHAEAVTVSSVVPSEGWK